MESRQRITDSEREAVRQLIEEIYARWAATRGSHEKDSYAEFAREANVSYNSLSVWRAAAHAKKRSTPEAFELMKLLRVAGVLGQQFELPVRPVAEELATARAEVQAVQERQGLGAQKTRGRARRASGGGPK